MRGAGLQGRFPSRLRVGVLVGYNCISCYTRKIGSYPYTAGSFLQSCVVNSPDGIRLHSVGSTHPVRASTLWASSWVSWGNIPHTLRRRVVTAVALGRAGGSRARLPHARQPRADVCRPCRGPEPPCVAPPRRALCACLHCAAGAFAPLGSVLLWPGQL